ncbi:MAG: YceD family protein [Gaiella sp.]
MSQFSLRQLKLRPGEEHHEPVAIESDPLVLGGSVYQPAPTPIDGLLTVQRATSGDVFRLRFATELNGPCMRCLEDARIEVDVDAQEYEAADPTADDELRSDYVADGELDLTAWARDQIAFSLPQQILCRPDCAGLCPVCGKNLNEERHTHDESAIDPRWAALEALTRGDT